MDAEQKKKRTFKKFTYRGVDLEKLLDMSPKDLMELVDVSGCCVLLFQCRYDMVSNSDIGSCSS